MATTSKALGPDGVADPAVSAGAIAAVRAALDDANYEESAVSERVGIDSVYAFTPLSDGGREAREIGDALDLVIRLFLDSEAVPLKTVKALLGDSTTAFFEAGLLRKASRNRVQPTVLLYPTGPLRLVSDLRSTCRKTTRKAPVPDAVYPAITQNTRLFVAGLPTGPCERLLELCGGTGIGALLGAHEAGHAWSADITPRATRFAAFNASLNGIDNFTAACGDLYEPVRGVSFDRILAHPPYVAASSQQVVFRDGGADGEGVTQRILASLPDYLEPGGILYCTCAGTDRKDAPFEQRAREMLGNRNAGYDVVLVTTNVHDADEYCADLMVDKDTSRAEAQHTVRTYRQLGVERVVIGSIIVRRQPVPAPALTLRRPMGDSAAAPAAEWLLWWENEARAPAMMDRLLASRPSLAPGVSRRISQTNTPDGWVVDSCGYSVMNPFAVSIAPSASVVQFISHFDGQITLREHIGRLAQDGKAGQSSIDGLADMVRSLAAGGILDLGPEWPAVPA